MDELSSVGHGAHCRADLQKTYHSPCNKANIQTIRKQVINPREERDGDNLSIMCIKNRNIVQFL